MLASIMHFGTSDTTHPAPDYGDRNPSIFFKPGTLELMVIHAVSGDKEYKYESPGSKARVVKRTIFRSSPFFCSNSKIIFV